MSPAPDPKRDRLLAAVMSVLALAPCGLGGWTLSRGLRPTRTYADASELERVAPPAFVRVQVTLLPHTVRVLHASSAAHYLVHTEEGVLLYVSGHTDLGQALRGAYPLPSLTPDPAMTARIRRPHVVEGALYEVGDYPLLSTDLPGSLIDRYAEAQGLPPGTRMIETGHGPGSVVAIGAMPIVCCAFPFFGLGLFAALRYRARRDARTE